MSGRQLTIARWCFRRDSRHQQAATAFEQAKNLVLIPKDQTCAVIWIVPFVILVPDVAGRIVISTENLCDRPSQRAFFFCSPERRFDFDLMQRQQMRARYPD